MRASAYAGLPYPLNAFGYVLTAEEGDVDALHYGLFDGPADSLRAAQERATELLLSRLPPPPACLLDVGSGLGTTVARLVAMGFQASGITPDPVQVRLARRRHGAGVPVSCLAFEDVEAGRHYDAVVFQESAQYIAGETLFATARQVTAAVIVMDEFALDANSPGSLHALGPFLAAARGQGFDLTEAVDLSQQAAPTIDWFTDRFSRHRDALVREVGLAPAQVEELLVAGPTNADLYRRGLYGYRLLQFHA